MRRGVSVFVLVVTALAGPTYAQGGGGGFGSGGSGLPSGIDGPRTIPQQFAAKLKLDETQGPAVDQILTTAAADAAPPAQQMLLARQRLLNAVHDNNPVETKAAEAAYASEAARLAGIEAVAFAKVLGLLKPGQQKEAPQAFALLAGLFSNAAVGGGAAARGGSRGRGGDR